MVVTLKLKDFAGKARRRTVMALRPTQDGGKSLDREINQFAKDFSSRTDRFVPEVKVSRKA